VCVANGPAGNVLDLHFGERDAPANRPFRYLNQTFRATTRIRTTQRDATVDIFVANVERRRDAQMVGVLYRNGVRVMVHEASTTGNGGSGPSDHLCPTVRTANDVPLVPVQHRPERDAIAAEQARHSNGDLLIHSLEKTDEGDHHNASSLLVDPEHRSRPVGKAKAVSVDRWPP